MIVKARTYTTLLPYGIPARYPGTWYGEPKESVLFGGAALNNCDVQHMKLKAS